MVCQCLKVIPATLPFLDLVLGQMVTSTDRTGLQLFHQCASSFSSRNPVSIAVGQHRFDLLQEICHWAVYLTTPTIGS
jgi:hypothetical protein